MHPLLVNASPWQTHAGAPPPPVLLPFSLVLLKGKLVLVKPQGVGMVVDRTHERVAEKGWTGSFV